MKFGELLKVSRAFEGELENHSSSSEISQINLVPDPHGVRHRRSEQGRAGNEAAPGSRGWYEWFWAGREPNGPEITLAEIRILSICR